MKNQLHNTELHNIISVIIPRILRLVGHEARTGEMGITYKIFVREPQATRKLERTGSAWETDNEMFLV